MTFRIALTFFLLGLCGHIYPCKCAGTATVKESFKQADNVINGRVISKELVSFAETLRADIRNQIRERFKKDNDNTELFDDKQIVQIKLEVIANFKANTVSDTITIYTTIGGPSCGYNFEMGKEYIVYGFTKGHADSFYLTESERLDSLDNRNSFWTNRCTRTIEYNKQEADELRELGKKSR